MNERMVKALNEQINAEMYSSYLYLSMSAYFQGISLDGMSSWMRIQAMEELTHAMRLYDFILERGGNVDLKRIESPERNWESPLHVFETTYAHELKVTSLINELVNVAVEEKDHATNNFLQWFVAEQVEEEASADLVLQRLKLVGNQGDGLFMVDRELAKRAFVPPVGVTVGLPA